MGPYGQNNVYILGWLGYYLPHHLFSFEIGKIWVGRTTVNGEKKGRYGLINLTPGLEEQMDSTVSYQSLFIHI